ncbi:hypothetical protein BU26DRAFT_568015 [Trematosphaeria pertusa]|uniref:Uncharacterized protein n=1 Tax=Trematosphaeria pertusa TaxID=390896 RepID=A0A6A6I5C7_9PLEO|nr:uncharacterized protein BU26DRAFT_568015 [Trematosphaeria pertusa]KAF2245429.1 hypothetical protein BU26DRAFT_568015 [Trematosphaeria pertusa]
MASTHPTAAASATFTPTLKQSNVTPKGLPPKVTLILAITLPCIVILAVVMGIVHCILKRHRKKLETNRCEDAEAQMPVAVAPPQRSPRLPNITVDTAVPYQASVAFPPPQPQLLSPAHALGSQNGVQARTARLAGATSPVSPLDAMQYQPSASPLSPISAHDRLPVQLYDPVARRTIYLG